MAGLVMHQVGHSSVWNKDSLIEDGAGDGLILSPLHQKRSVVENLPVELRRASLFDPQFYLPNSPKRHLATYPFFPEVIADGFTTGGFSHFAIDAARQCIDFQTGQEFSAIVLPARFERQMSSKFFEKHMSFTVEPFLKVLRESGTKNAVYMTVPVTSAMLEEEDFRVDLLNWITAFPEISGVYLMIADERKTKQIQSSSVLNAILDFVANMRAVDLNVVVGHQNSESVLLTLVDDVSVTMGAYENTRMFSLDKFVQSDEERRAPKSRIYVPGLFNWIQFDHARQIRAADRKLWDAMFVETSYSEAAFEAAVEPHFTQARLYKHHFIVMDAQLKSLMGLERLARWSRLREELKRGMTFYEAISELPVDLDPHGAGGHLQPWLDSANSYRRKHLM